MKHLALLPFIALIVCCNSSSTEPVEKAENHSAYDSTLAKELGADEYGMKRYVMAFLVAGPNRRIFATRPFGQYLPHGGGGQAGIGRPFSG